jgi:hypothetical protein
MSNRPDCPLTHGRFRNAEELDEYESLWHERVFTPAWEELKEKVRPSIHPPCLIIIGSFVVYEIFVAVAEPAVH